MNVVEMIKGKKLRAKLRKECANVRERKCIKEGTREVWRLACTKLVRRLYYR